MVGTFVGGCKCPMSWYELDLTFVLFRSDHEFVNLVRAISWILLGTEWWGHWLGGIGLHYLRAIFETCFS